MNRIIPISEEDIVDLGIDEFPMVKTETRKIPNMLGGKRCANPGCLNIIWSNGFHYGKGKYCDEDCSMIARDQRTMKAERVKVVKEKTKNIFFHKDFGTMLTI